MLLVKKVETLGLVFTQMRVVPILKEIQITTKSNFKGYKDFMLDNLEIEEIKLTGKMIIDEAYEKNTPIVNGNYKQDSLNAYKDAVAAFIRSRR